jgi:hypothetical protein
VDEYKWLTNLGFKVYYVTDMFTAPLMDSLTGSKENVIMFPVEGDINSQHHALKLLNQLQPYLLISIERCGWFHA